MVLLNAVLFAALLPLPQTGNRFASAATIDQLHMVCAAMYMLDHHVLIRVLDVSPAYARAYYAAFATMLAAMGVARRLFAWDESTYVASAMTSSASASASSTALTAAAISARPAWLLFALELVVMVCENALFFSFVAGMTSGLRAAATESGGGDAAAPLKDDTTQKRIEQPSSVALPVDAVMQQQQQPKTLVAALRAAASTANLRSECAMRRQRILISLFQMQHHSIAPNGAPCASAHDWKRNCHH